MSQETDKLRMLNEVAEYNSDYPKEKLVKITGAMKVIDRKAFVPKDHEASAYDDNPLPIGEGQTISQPSTVARMLLILELEKGMSVLEIGAGSGWNAAIISYLANPGKVVAVERIPMLAINAKKSIDNLKKIISSSEKSKLSKLELKAENALDKKSSVWKQKYDRIIVTAGIEIGDSKTYKIIENMASQLLKEKGILLCPYTVGPLLIYRKDKKLKVEKSKEEYVFVPLMEEARS